jgi:ribosomal protein L4
MEDTKDIEQKIQKQIIEKEKAKIQLENEIIQLKMALRNLRTFRALATQNQQAGR